MRRIALIVVCALAVAHGQNRGSRRFTPSPFLEGQDLGFVPWRQTTPQPWAGQSGAWQASPGSRGTSRRRTTPQPELGDNDIDDGFGNVSPAKETVRRTPVAPAAPAAPAVFRRQPQRTRTSVRRRQPARTEALTQTEDDVSEATTETSAVTTASPSRRRTTTKAAETTTLSLLRQQVEALKKQARPSATTSTSTKRFRGRRVKKIRRIIHPGDEADDAEEEEEDDEVETEQELQKSEETAEKSEETAENSEETVKKSEETAEQSSESTEESSESATTTTTTQSPLILRRQKKIFRQPTRGRVGESRRQFSSRRRVVAPGTTEATISEPTTAPTVSISTSSPFEPFPLDEKDTENSITGEEGIGAAFTKLTSSAGGESNGISSSSSSSASVSSSASNAEVTSSSQSSSEEAESSSAENEISSDRTAVRRPISRGSVRASSAFSQTGGQQVSRGRGRARGSARGSVSSISSSSASASSSSSSSSSDISTSRRQFARRRRPSASASVNAITTTPATTTTTEAATTTTTAAAFDSTSTEYGGPTTTLSYGDDGLSFPNSLESDAPTPDQVSFNFGPATGRPFPTVTSSPSFGGFQPVNSGTFRFGSGTATRFGVTPRPVSSTTFAPAFNPTTPAFSTQFFEGNFGIKGFGPTTPVSSTVFSNTITDSEFQPTPAPQPATFVSSSSRGSGSGRPNFGSFSFGATSSGSSSGSSSSSSSSFGNNPFFNSVTARPTFRPTTAEPSTTSFGFSGPTVGSNAQRFGSQSTATTGGFRPISFSTRHPAPSFSSNTDNNVRISSNGAFSFGTGVAAPAVTGPDFGPRETTPSVAFTTFTTPRPFTSSFGFRPTSPSVRVPAVLTEAARFFGSQPGPTAQTNFGSLGGSVSSFSHATEHPAPGFSSGSFSFGTAATEASTLVQSLATSPAAPATDPTEPPQIFGDVTEWPKTHSATEWPQTSPPVTARPVSQPPLTSGQTFFQTSQQQNSIRNSLQEISRGPQKQHSVQKSKTSLSVSSSSSTSSQNSLNSVRSESSGRSFGSSTSSNSIFGRGGVRGFEFQQEGGIITRSSHLRGFDTRLPAFHENVVISDPVFTNKDIKPGFTCEGKPYGYYADEANDCKIFHICQPVDVSSVAKFYTRYSFFCGSETRFDQSKLSCLHDKDAMPCSETPSWLFRNDDFGKQEKRTDEQRFEEEVFNAPQAV